MKTKNKIILILKVTLLSFVLLVLLSVNSIAAETKSPDSNQSSKYLDAVREFADNVLKYSRDTYGPKQTPLFVDGVNVNTHEPVKWISPKAEVRGVLTTTETEEWLHHESMRSPYEE